MKRVTGQLSTKNGMKISDIELYVDDSATVEQIQGRILSEYLNCSFEEERGYEAYRDTVVKYRKVSDNSTNGAANNSSSNTESDDNAFNRINDELSFETKAADVIRKYGHNRLDQVREILINNGWLLNNADKQAVNLLYQYGDEAVQYAFDCMEEDYK